MKPNILTSGIPVKKHLNRFSVRTKLIIMLLVVSLGAMMASTYICSKVGEDILSQKVFQQLTAVQGSTITQLESYFKFVINHTKTLSNNDMFINAMKESKQTFDKLSQVKIPKSYDEKLLEFYRQEFIPRLKKTMDAEPFAETFLPKTVPARYIQYHYIANNPFPVGEKYKLTDAGDGSEYSKVSGKYTDKFDELAKSFGYRDLYLIDMQGNIVYLLSAEADYGINLLNGPLAESNLTQAYRDCRRSSSPGYVKVADYEPYIMAYNAPSAFVTSPIFDGSKMIGVLAFKLPAEGIDKIVNFNRQWVENGLGKTGEVVLAGPDSLMRANSRFLIEDIEIFTKNLLQNGTPESIVRKINHFKTTILTLPTRSKGIEIALKGKKESLFLTDYRGVPVLGAYGPIEFNGLQWAMGVKMDRTEAFASIADFQRKVLITAALIIAIVTLVAMWLSRLFSQPIERMIATAEQIEGGDENVLVVAGTGDEFNDLARVFNQTLYNLRKEIRDRDRELKEDEILIKKLMPIHIASRLKAGEGMVADPAGNVTIVFTDLHRFTKLFHSMTSDRVVFTLDELVDIFDDLLDKYALEKIKTIGDGYMAVCGLTVPYIDSEKRTLDCALEMLAAIQRFNNERDLDLDLRIGINTGDVIAGTVGKSRFNYDIWGESVNIAYRLKSACPPGCILVSGKIHERLIDVYEFEPFRAISEPGKEALEAWQLRGNSSNKERSAGKPNTKAESRSAAKSTKPEGNGTISQRSPGKILPQGNDSGSHSSSPESRNGSAAVGRKISPKSSEARSQPEEQADSSNANGKFRQTLDTWKQSIQSLVYGQTSAENEPLPLDKTTDAQNQSEEK